MMDWRNTQKEDILSVLYLRLMALSQPIALSKHSMRPSAVSLVPEEKGFWASFSTPPLLAEWEGNYFWKTESGDITLY